MLNLGMITYENAIVVPHPVDEVFDFVARNYVTNHPKWAPPIRVFNQISDGPMGMGTTIHQERIVNHLLRVTDLEIYVYEPPRSFGFRVISGDVPATAVYTFTPEGTGTRINFRFDMPLEGKHRIFKPLISYGVKRDMAADLQRLQSILAAPTASASAS